MACGKEIVFKRFHKWYGTPKYFSAAHATKHRTKGKKTGKANFKGKHHNEQHKLNVSIRRQREEALRNLYFNLQVFPWDNSGVMYFCAPNVKKYRCHQTKESQEKRMRARKYTPLSEETKIKISINGTGKHTACGWNQTEESKLQNSKSHKGLLCVKKNGMYGRPPSPLANRGIRTWYMSPLQGQVCFRSSYELAYAKYLDSIHELWMYEMETFELGQMTYTPDFFLPRRELFIEIKGYMTKDAQTKINQFKEQYPWDLEILFGKDLKLLKII